MDTMIIKLVLSSKKDWDKAIIEWLSKVPRGYRATIVKRELHLMLTGSKKDVFSTKSEDKGGEDINHAISKIISMKKGGQN